jgi:hypothetical protein
VEFSLNGAAQIILASTLGLATVLRALAVFLPVWREKSKGPSLRIDLSTEPDALPGLAEKALREG